MQTKDKLLTLLQSRKGEFASGEEIAEALTLSRTAVWKAANALRASGYRIEAVRNRGYRLAAGADILCKSDMEALLGTDGEGLTLEVLSCVDSTNSLLREKANAGIPEGYVVLAGQQTGGRGRMGRRFYSPPDTGLYLSLLLRPTHLLPSEAVGITTMAAVAACRSIEEVSPGDAQIKWVNDIYLGGKKVCGILTEASIGLESGSLDYAVVGVGFNVCAPEDGFPGGLSQIAGGRRLPEILPHHLPQRRHRLRGGIPPPQSGHRQTHPGALPRRAAPRLCPGRGQQLPPDRPLRRRKRRGSLLLGGQHPSDLVLRSCPGAMPKLSRKARWKAE